MDIVVSPTIVGFNPQQGSHPQGLTVGQLVDALVLKLIDDVTAQVSVAGKTFNIATQIPLVPGSTVRLAVRGHGSDLKYVVVGTNARTPGDAPRSQAQPQSESQPSPQPQGQAVGGDATASPASPVETSVQTTSSVSQTADVAAPPPQPPPRVVDPAAALASAVRAAAARQTGVAPLLAEAAVAVQSPGVPAPVRQALGQLLSLPVSLESETPEAVLRQAFSRSGLFLEARLAGNQPAGSQTTTAAPTPATDLKAALLTVRQLLDAWLGPASGGATAAKLLATDALVRTPLPQVAAPLQPQALAAASYGQAAASHGQPAPQADSHGLAPPYRNAPTAGQGPALPVVAADASPELIGHALREQADGALARLTLLQAASLPDHAGPQAGGPGSDSVHWNFEIPFVAQQGTAVAHFEINRDGHKSASREQAGFGWRVNLSLELEPMGPVHVQIALTGHRAAVRLWAERQATAMALRASTGELSSALREAALEPSDIVVSVGAPPRPTKPAAGQFLDRAS